MPARPEAAARRALAGSAAALLAALGCIAMQLPPLAGSSLAAPLPTALVVLALAGAMLLHWCLLGRAARCLGQSVVAWVGLAVLLFPVGSAAALMLLGGAGRTRHGGAHAI